MPGRAESPAGLTPRQSVALSRELDDVVTLFRHGRAALRDRNFVTVDSSVVFVCLAGGAEKLLKLSLGLLSLDTTGAWPTTKRMKSEWGHDIPQMDRALRAQIRDRVHMSAARPYLAGLLDETEADGVIAQVLAILGRYAQMGRFHNLDALSAEPAQPSPQDLWDELETGLLRADPDLMAKLIDLDGWDEARGSLNHLIDDSIAAWQLVIFRSWQHGVLGSQARQWSGQLSDWSR